MGGLLLALIGLMAGGLLGVALSSARVAARALADVSSTLRSNDWLSLGMPPRAARGEPAGSQGEEGHRMTRTGDAPGPGRQPVHASPACEGSRSSHRAETTAAPRTPKKPPRRDRRNPSVGWAWLSRHAPRFPTGPGGDHSIPPQPPRPPRPPREEGEEQWTWG
ncbi:MAG TPA: hypothetical protein VII47_08115 [Actinomycetota bacterium]